MTKFLIKDENDIATRKIIIKDDYLSNQVLIPIDFYTKNNYEHKSPLNHLFMLIGKDNR